MLVDDCSAPTASPAEEMTFQHMTLLQGNLPSRTWLQGRSLDSCRADTALFQAAEMSTWNVEIQSCFRKTRTVSEEAADVGAAVLDHGRDRTRVQGDNAAVG